MRSETDLGRKADFKLALLQAFILVLTVRTINSSFYWDKKSRKQKLYYYAR